MNTKIEKAICDAIEIIVNRKVATAKFNKTIQATVLSCEDAATGKHKCKYQDSVFFAFDINNRVYEPNTTVYVLIQNSDMNKEKLILSNSKI